MTITIKKNAYDAITWASKQFGKSGFKVQHAWPSNYWAFTFDDQNKASLFALKWVS